MKKSRFRDMLKSSSPSNRSNLENTHNVYCYKAGYRLIANKRTTTFILYQNNEMLWERYIREMRLCK